MSLRPDITVMVDWALKQQFASFVPQHSLGADTPMTFDKGYSCFFSFNKYYADLATTVISPQPVINPVHND